MPSYLRQRVPVVGPLSRCLALGLVATACGGDSGPDGPAVVVDTVAGAERVTYGAEPGSRLDWDVADTVAVIGDAMAADPYLFGLPGPDDLVGTDDGGVVLVDRDGNRILEYGPGGRHRATYGREGAGPGELRYPAGVALGPGDTVWVNDLGNRRLTGYPRSGGEPRSVPYTRGDVFPGSRIAALEDGFLQVVGSIGAPGQPVAEPLLRLDRSLEPLDTLWVRPPDRIDMVELDLDGQTVIVGMSQEFHPEFHWRGLGGDRVVVADSADYVFRIIDVDDGSVHRVIRREPSARSTADSDRQAARERILGDAGFSVSVDGNSPDEDARRRMAEARADAMTFYPRIPRIVALRVDRSDRIWVGVSEDSADVVQRIDIYEADGRLLGELRGVAFPDAFTGTDRVVYKRTDALDVPQVVVARLRKGPATD